MSGLATIHLLEQSSDRKFVALCKQSLTSMDLRVSQVFLDTPNCTGCITEQGLREEALLVIQHELREEARREYALEMDAETARREGYLPFGRTYARVVQL